MSDDMNTGRPAIIVYETLSGVIVHVTPLSIFTIQAIRDRAEQEFPYPDPADYRLPLENAVEGVTLPASENPEYQALCKPIDDQRQNWKVQAYIDMSCTFPAFESRAEMIERFKPRLEQLRKVSLMSDDDWQNVLNHCVLTGRPDKQALVSLALQDAAIPLTPAEVVEGVRFFRVDLSGRKAGQLAG